MTDDLLTNFRSEMPVPDEDTTQRVYERATTGRRRFVTRRTLIAVVAVLAAAGIAGGLTVALSGSGSKSPTESSAAGGPGPGAGGISKIGLNPLSTNFTADGNQYTAIDVSLLSMAGDQPVTVRVVRSSASDVADADTASNDVVFEEHVATTTDNSNPEDGSLSTWSGTLKPSEWTGGCQEALYRIEYTFGSSGIDSSSAWFQCSGPKVDASNPFLYAVVPAGPSGAAGAAG